MLVFYALEDQSGLSIPGFEGPCALASLYRFLQGAWPFGIIEVIWSAIAFRRWQTRMAQSK
jgi:hypothetical protein